MFKKVLFISLFIAVISVACSVASTLSSEAQATTVPPVEKTCVVTNDEFASWFADGSISKNGLVKPADSLKPLDDNCDFHKWSWQMFLWITSPVDYGRLVLDSTSFFDLSENNNLVSNAPGNTNKPSVRGGKIERLGQAGIVNGALISQNVGITPEGSLVYYAIHVNDVYAYFASGVNSGDPELKKMKQFPTTEVDLRRITTYAKRTYGAEINNPNALTMELKSSWVRVGDGMDASQYITVKADIPKYEKKSATEWTWDGTSLEKGATLAMVGIHVVGSVKGHPEMIWATFEHVNNAPNADFQYKDSDGSVTTHSSFNSDGTAKKKKWLFFDDGTKKSANQMRMELEGKDLIAEKNMTIGPSNTYRTHAWGNISGAIEENTSILSLNESILGKLETGDIRKNYILIGSVWTTNGVPGVGDQKPVYQGSKKLANATMETYFQYKQCFDCHQGGEINGLSHIFSEIKPLPIQTK